MTSHASVDWVRLACEVSDDCLACPLSRCRAEDPRWYARLLKTGKNAALAAMMCQGHDAGTVAAAFGVSARTVYRAVNRCRISEFNQSDLAVAARLYVRQGEKVERTYPTTATPSRYCDKRRGTRVC